MRIWLINHYAVPLQYYPLARPSLFAKNLIAMGHDVIIIAASTVHNSDLNLIEGTEIVKRIEDEGIPYVLIKCSDYQGNGIKRVINILQFAYKLPRILDTLDKPDAIVATSFDPLSCYVGVKYAKNRGIKAIAEIADLWPETLVAYTSVSRNNPVVRILRNIEKKIYTQADEIVFTMAGGYDYIKDQGWHREIPESKVHNINNGIDLELFEINKDKYQIEDPDLNCDDFKIVYAGSIRRANNVGQLLDVAKRISEKKVKFLIWGDGDEAEILKQRAIRESINNVVFKGKVAKKYIPYITSMCDLGIMHIKQTSVVKYGLSLNKMFDYMAAGLPVLTDCETDYNPTIMGNCGLTSGCDDADKIAQCIIEYINKSDDEKRNFSKNAIDTAKKYSFKELSKKLIEIIKE